MSAFALLVGCSEDRLGPVYLTPEDWHMMVRPLGNVCLKSRSSILGDESLPADSNQLESYTCTLNDRTLRYSTRGAFERGTCMIEVESGGNTPLDPDAILEIIEPKLRSKIRDKLALKRLDVPYEIIFSIGRVRVWAHQEYSYVTGVSFTRFVIDGCDRKYSKQGNHYVGRPKDEQP